MRRIVVGLIGLALVPAVVAGLGTPAASAAPRTVGAPVLAPADKTDKADKGVRRSDDLPSRAETKRRELRERALTMVLNGKAKPARRGKSSVVRVSSRPASTSAGRRTIAGTAPHQDQYVELAREQTDRVFVVLAEFGTDRHPDYPDQDTDPATPGPIRFDGPGHNEIPAPDRTKDNSNHWVPDFSQDYYDRLYFGTDEDAESLKTYYERQSSGRYSIDGTVTDWVRVRYNQARYGRKGGDAQFLVRDALDQWVAREKARGRTDEQIRAELKTFDVWDRNDFDADGDFNEPDGYLDHFQIVHAGGSEADGDPYYGEDAIWSHRSYVFAGGEGRTGPPDNLRGGTQVGATGLWVGDYTMQSESGGLSVFTHEFGHDLGLPDHYNTSGGGENGVNWWSIMGQSRFSVPADQSIRTRSADLSAWDKLQLGWLDYEVVVAGQNKTLELGPHEYYSDKAQGVVVVLPKKRVTKEYGKPAAGARMWWSTKGDDLATSMTRQLDLTGKSSATLTLKARYDIEGECDCDYLYVQSSTDGGKTWTSLDGTIDGKPFVRDGAGNPAISGSSNLKWVDVNVPLSALAGTSSQLRFYYRTDGGVAPDGFFADEISIVADGVPVFTDGAESGANGWTLNGFVGTTGTEVRDYDNYYVASHRSYVSFDKYLETGPYNFGFAPTRPNWVERFPYQEGLLISYWDTAYADNNTSQHPGEGLILPIDAHPEPIYNLTGAAWRARIAGYDAPFSLRKADSLTLHLNGRRMYIRGQAAQPTFDDRNQYWFPEQPFAGVKVPNAGVRISVLERDGTSMRIRISSTR